MNAICLSDGLRKKKIIFLSTLYPLQGLSKSYITELLEGISSQNV